MALQKAVDDLKDRPKDEKKAVAGGIAIAVVLLLFFGWAFLFLKKIQKGGVGADLGSGAQSEFNFSSVRDAQQKLLEGYSGQSAAEQELLDIRNQSNSQYQQSVEQQQYEEATDPFGAQNGDL